MIPPHITQPDHSPTATTTSSHSHVYCMKVLSQKTNQTITLRIPGDGFSKICLLSKDFHISQLVNLFSDSKLLFDFLVNNKAPFAEKMKQPKSWPQIYRMARVTGDMSVLRTAHFNAVYDQFKHFLSYLRLLKCTK